MRRRAILFVLFLATGCGGAAQMKPENRRALLGLQTAVSSQKGDWLDAAVKLIEERRSKGDLTDSEYAAVQPIIEKARKGDWAGAQHDAFALSEAQKPTAEDLQRIKPQAPGR